MEMLCLWGGAKATLLVSQLVKGRFAAGVVQWALGTLTLCILSWGIRAYSHEWPAGDEAAGAFGFLLLILPLCAIVSWVLIGVLYLCKREERDVVRRAWVDPVTSASIVLSATIFSLLIWRQS